MLDYFDLFSPRIYVVSDAEYQKYKARKNKEAISSLESRKASYLEIVSKIDKEIAALSGEFVVT